MTCSFVASRYFNTEPMDRRERTMICFFGTELTNSFLNEKNFKTECFELKEVYYYVKYTEREIKEEEVIADEDIIREIDARL